MPILENAKHERFPRDGFYVYALIDPRDGKPFYVGKGKGRRYLAHAAEVRAGRVTNAAKFAQIDAIHRAGLKVEAVCLATCRSENEAFAKERSVIAKFGFDALTNIKPGTVTTAAKAIEKAKQLLRSVKPFCDWSNGKSKDDIALYWRVVEGLSRSASLPI